MKMNLSKLDEVTNMVQREKYMEIYNTFLSYEDTDIRELFGFLMENGVIEEEEFYKLENKIEKLEEAVYREVHKFDKQRLDEIKRRTI